MLGVPVPAARDRDRVPPLGQHRQGNPHGRDRDHRRLHPAVLPRRPQPRRSAFARSRTSRPRERSGARPFTVIRKYVFFNVVQNVPPLATLNAADAILTLAALGFLGYGIQPTDAAEWGYDIQRAVSDASSNIWWTGLFPGLAIVLLVTGHHPARRRAERDAQPGAARRGVKVDVEFPAVEPANGRRRDRGAGRLGPRPPRLLRDATRLRARRRRRLAGHRRRGGGRSRRRVGLRQVDARARDPRAAPGGRAADGEVLYGGRNLVGDVAEGAAQASRPRPRARSSRSR